ncbi:MAG: hypothetical protein ACHQQS_13125 [Thermoanaerobaculales bacterium]
MPRRLFLLQLLLAAVLLAAAITLVAGRGIGGAADATNLARSALARLGYQPIGQPHPTFQVDQELAWALERARPGPPGVALGRGEGAAVSWRVVFPGGGEAVVTTGGVVWSARRPVPSAPGKDLFPSQARSRVEAALAVAVPDVAGWKLVRAASWREGGHIWQRGWFAGEAGPLPTGWRRELELEMVGSTVVAWRRAVQPLGTDLGVVTGRIAELELLRKPALVGLGLVVIGVLLAAAEAVAYREALRPFRGLAFGAATVACGVLAGSSALAAGAWGVAVAIVVAVLPTWTDLPGRQWRWGPAIGFLLALVALGGRTVILGAGGWTPVTPLIGSNLGADRLLTEAWFPALAEEPLLRGALPALATPLVGWWGAALLAAPAGALLHPQPAVPLAASLALELLVQLGLALAARFAGVGGAVLARGTYELLLRRAAFPSGADWDVVGLAGVLLGAVMLLWPPRDE